MNTIKVTRLRKSPNKIIDAVIMFLEKLEREEAPFTDLKLAHTVTLEFIAMGGANQTMLVVENNPHTNCIHIRRPNDHTDVARVQLVPIMEDHEMEWCRCGFKLPCEEIEPAGSPDADCPYRNDLYPGQCECCWRCGYVFTVPD